MRTLILVSLICTGCATGPSVSISTYSMTMSYWRDCVGLDARYRATDEECRYRTGPAPQPGAVRAIDERPYNQRAVWEQVEIISYCRSNPGNDQAVCKDVPEVANR